MTTIWPTELLVNLVESGDISYGIVQPGNPKSNGVPIIRVKDVRNGHIDTSDPMRVDESIDDRHRRTRLNGGELVVSLVGTVGEAAVVPLELKGWNVARAIAVLRPSSVSAQWLKYCFDAGPTRMQIESLLNTTVQATLNLKDLKSVRVPVPPESDRTAIGEVLGALDDKIAANRKLTSVADELSHAHFLEIAQGAEGAPLSAIAKFVNGKAFTKGASGTGRVVIRIAELNSGLGSSTVRSDIDVDDQYTARPGDILFAWSGSLTLHRWFRDEAIVNQHIFKVVPNDGMPPWLVYQLIAHKLPYFKDVAADKATTMGHIQRKHLDELVPVPSARQIEEKSELMSALWERALLAEQEAEKLISVRDALLPRLMSGELRVRDAEDVVSSAL